MSAPQNPTTATVPERLLTLKEVQTLAKVSRGQVWKWRAERALPTVRIGGTLRVRESAFWSWLERQDESGAT